MTARFRIQLQPTDLARIRFAHSPLVELVTSYRLLHSTKPRSLYQRWLSSTHQALYGLDFPYLAALLSAPVYIPDFLTPTPCRADLTLEDEIEALLQTPVAVIRRNVSFLINLTGETEILRHYLAFPQETLLCLVDELRLYWQRAIAPHWSRMIAVIEGDLLFRARQLALEGPETLLTSLNPEMRLEQMHLVKEISDAMFTKQQQLGTCYVSEVRVIEHDDRPAERDLLMRLPGTGLQLVPALFSGSHIMWQIEPEWQPMLVYAPRGGGLWQQETGSHISHSLEIALGAARARVLQLLVTPANTGEIARRLHLTAGAVSQHLGRLNEAGLVEPHRSGRRVFYHLTPRGKDLIELFERSY